MSNKLEKNKLMKVKTGIPGFDHITDGGLPQHRTTLLSGTAGSGKTVMGIQFLAEGIIKFNVPGVFVTFEESPEDIKKNMIGLGWDIAKWEKEGKFVFVDASPEPYDEITQIGDYDLGAIIARIEYAVSKINATRLTLDSLGAIFNQLPQSNLLRTELFKLSTALKKMKVTAILTSERTNEYGEISRYGIEEFVTDNVIVLRNILEGEKRRRTIEILKFRGTTHKKGEHAFSVQPDEGVVVIPLSAMELMQRSSNVRISSGNKTLDKMCGGGFFRDSIVLVSGATGNGKTLMVTEFIKTAQKEKEKTIVFAFEESRQQLLRNARGWGLDFTQMEKEGNLHIECIYPEAMNLEDHLIKMKKLIAEYKPARIAVDSLSALERSGSVKVFREFVIGLTSFIKSKEIVGLFTATTRDMMGGPSVTESHVSTITDSIILLRYVEMFGEMKRCITVLKMRGSLHDKDIREFTIDGEGMHIGNQIKNVSGIMSGNPQYASPDAISRIDKMFE